MKPSMLAIAAVFCVAGCTALEGRGTPLGALTTPYEPAAPRYTSKGQAVLCDTAGPPGRAVIRCH